MLKTYFASGLAALMMFIYAQYAGLSAFGSDEEKSRAGYSHSATHK